MACGSPGRISCGRDGNDNEGGDFRNSDFHVIGFSFHICFLFSSAAFSGHGRLSSRGLHQVLVVYNLQASDLCLLWRTCNHNAIRARRIREFIAMRYVSQRVSKPQEHKYLVVICKMVLGRLDSAWVPRKILPALMMQSSLAIARLTGDPARRIHDEQFPRACYRAG